jgi:hypothetical protein
MHVLLLTAVTALASASPWRLDASYLGELGTHPGAAAALDWQPSPSGPVVGALLGGYRHPGNSFGARAELHAGYRLQLPWDFALELVAGAGYLHTVVDGTLYDATTLEPVTDFGRPSFSPSLALGAWWRSGFLRAGAFGQYPFNGRVLVHPTVELGFSFDLGGGR